MKERQTLTNWYPIKNVIINIIYDASYRRSKYISVSFRRIDYEREKERERETGIASNSRSLLKIPESVNIWYTYRLFYIIQRIVSPSIYMPTRKERKKERMKRVSAQLETCLSFVFVSQLKSSMCARPWLIVCLHRMDMKK